PPPSAAPPPPRLPPPPYRRTRSLHSSRRRRPCTAPLGGHLRSLKHHGASRFASTSVVKQSSVGLFGWFLGGNSSQLPPLDVPLPGITLPPPLPDFVEPSKTKSPLFQMASRLHQIHRRGLNSDSRCISGTVH
uniref:Uncharacterized protein n=1 Tax=Oryza brachyantha TaxID=4533 RepID=J3M914_ORYBR